MLNKFDQRDINFLKRLTNDDLQSLDKDDLISIFNYIRSYYEHDTKERQRYFRIFEQCKIIHDAKSFDRDFFNNY